MKERIRHQRSARPDHRSVEPPAPDERSPLASPAAGFTATLVGPEAGRDSEPTTAHRTGASGGHRIDQLAIHGRGSAGSPGQPLPGDLATQFAQSLGPDVHKARVHTDPPSSALASSLNASAVTVGHQIHFRSGEYRPELPAGRGLLAHEAVHVAQQAGASGLVADPVGGALESEATRLAPLVDRGVPVRPSPSAALAPAASTETVAMRETSTPQSSNGAVAAPTAAPTQAQPTGPADVNVGFNPMDITHKLLIAIDQSQIVMTKMTRKVDYKTVVDLLSGLTPQQAKQVKDSYQAHEKGRSLETDLFGGGESGFDSNLTFDQRMRLSALLGGTKAGVGVTKAELQEIAFRKHRADAVELHELFHGEQSQESTERIMAMLRRPAEANLELGIAYQSLYFVTLPGEFGRLPVAQMPRALQLFLGRAADADAIQVGGQRGRLAAIDAKLTELKAIDGDMIETMIVRKKIKQLEDERKKLIGEVEQRVQSTMDESRAIASSQGADEATAGAVAQSRAMKLLGGQEGISAIGGLDAVALRAIVSDDPVPKAAADLLRAFTSETITPAMISSTVRGLREQAESRVKAENPGATAAELEAKGKALGQEYLERLRTSYQQFAVISTFDQLVAHTGDTEEVAANAALVQGAGWLSDVEELVHALAGDRKDMATVERVLKNKSAAEIKVLKAEFFGRSGGQSLDFLLFGEAPTKAGEENPELLGRHLKSQGKAEGTSRLNLEDYLQRPNEEGGLEEVNYVTARAEREYDYTIENRGMTGAWRDAWGNEERSLLDETIHEVRRIHWDYTFRTLAKPDFPRTAEAHQMLEDLRRARATIRGDRSAYEKATAELRALFQQIAAFALQIALSAVLGPLAAAAGRLVGAAAKVVQVVVKAAAATATSMVSTVGSNLIAYGNDYSFAMLKGDVLGCLGGAIGPAAVGRIAKSAGGTLAARLGPKVSKEMFDVGKAVGGHVVEVGKTVAGMETGAWAQGESVDLSLEEIIKSHGLGKLQDHLTTKTQNAIGLGEKPTAAPQAEQQVAPEPPPSAPKSPDGDGHGSQGHEQSKGVVEAPVPPAVEAPMPANPSADIPLVPDVRSPDDSTPVSPHGQAVPSKGTVKTPTEIGTHVETGDIVQHQDAGNEVQAWKLYEKLRAADPKREVAMIYNDLVGEWAVVQGDGRGVNLTEARRKLGWTEGDTIVGRHSHPTGPGGQTSEYNELPSGQAGDVQRIGHDAQKRPGTNWHAIDMVGPNGKPERTWLIHDPETGVYTVDYPDPAERGGRGSITFKTLPEYHDWYEKRFGFEPGPTTKTLPDSADTLRDIPMQAPDVAAPGSLDDVEPLFTPDQLRGGVSVDLATAGVSAQARNAAGGRLSADEMVALIKAKSRTLDFVPVGEALPRGGDETLLHLASAYGLEDYIRYHVHGPGTGREGYPIFLTPEPANQFANNHIEGFMRRQRDLGHQVEFRASYDLFGGQELRPFIEGMLRSNDPAVLGRLALDQGRIEHFMKEIRYEIRVTENGRTTTYEASITISVPPDPTITPMLPRPIP